MPVITTANGQLVYVTDEQYAEILRQQQQAQNQTPMQQPERGTNIVESGVGLYNAAEQLGLFGGGGGGAAASAGGVEAVGTALNGGTLMSDGTVLAPASSFGVMDVAGGAAGAYGLYNLLKNKKHGLEGAVQGGISGGLLGSATAGGLAAMGTTVAPGVGTAIGAGLGLALGYFGNMGDKDRYKDEYNRAQALRDKGIRWDWNSQEPTAGRSKEELMAIEEAKIKAGQYGNTAFAQSRNEADLKPEDIIGYATFGEQYGSKWAETTEAARKAIAQEALNRGLVREHHGTVDINFTPELIKYSEEILAKPPVDPANPQSQNSSQAQPQAPTTRPEPRPKPKPPQFLPGGVPAPGSDSATDYGEAQGARPYDRSAYAFAGNPLTFNSMLSTMRRGRSYAGLQ